MQKYVYSIDRYDLPASMQAQEDWQAGEDSLEDTIRRVVEQEDLVEGDALYIGEATPLELPDVATKDIIENMQEALYDANGIEKAWDWLQDVSGDDEEKLKKRLTEAFYGWAEETGHMPEGFTVTGIHAYGVTAAGEIYEKVRLHSR